MPPELRTLREAVATRLAAPAALISELTKEAEAAGLVAAGEWQAGSDAWEAAWGAICQASRPAGDTALPLAPPCVLPVLRSLWSGAAPGAR